MNTQKISLLFFLIGSLNSCIAKDHPADNGFSVIELFTSEGCSSCPPAERALENVSATYGSKVFVLEFHVDYWDYLGWKDQFSSHEYTARQQLYDEHFHLNSAYTPQAIVDGSAEMVGSDLQLITKTVANDLAKKVNGSIQISAKVIGTMVDVEYVGSNCGDCVFNIALVQKAADVQVKKGENSGRKLQHQNIVRDFQVVTQSKNAGHITFSMPRGLTGKDCQVVGYVQDKGTFKIEAATRCEILD